MPYIRKTGASRPLDRAIIRALAEHTDDESEGLHGYELARLVAHDPKLDYPTDTIGFRQSSSVYKSLRRLERIRAVTSQWEDAEVALEARRPRRRYYSLTENGRNRARLMPMWERVHATLLESYRNPGRFN